MLQRTDVKRLVAGLPVLVRKENHIEIRRKSAGMPLFVLGCLAFLAAFTGGLKALLIGLLIAAVCVAFAMKSRANLYIIDLDAMLFTWKITGIKFLDAGTIGLERITFVGIETVQVKRTIKRPEFSYFALLMKVESEKQFYLNYSTEEKDLAPLMYELNLAVQTARRRSNKTPEMLLHENADGSTLCDDKINLSQKRLADEY